MFTLNPKTSYCQWGGYILFELFFSVIWINGQTNGHFESWDISLDVSWPYHLIGKMSPLWSIIVIFLCLQGHLAFLRFKIDTKNAHKHTHMHLSVKKAVTPLRQTEWMQKAGWSSIGDTNMTTRMALPRRLRSQGVAENRELCGPALQKYFHVSDKDLPSSVRENGWVHLKLHIVRESSSFVLEKSLSHCTADTSTF